MDDHLLPWLRAQIAETAETAQKAYSRINPGEDRWVADGMQVRDGRGHLIVKHSWPAEIDHIVRHDPRTVLAQCEAHAALLDYAEELDDKGDRDEHLIRLVGLTYQHCSGYREEWRP